MTELKFSPQQEAALKLIANWYRSPSDKPAPFVFNGYAGTGKTTLAKFLPELLGLDEHQVIYCAFTGKAALQLRRKGCPKATTLHKLLYAPLEKDRSKLKELAHALRLALETDPAAEKHATCQLKRDLKSERRRVMAPSWTTSPDWDRIADGKLIVVDESSMVDLKICKDLAELGLPIIYCGDPFQLPPVKGISPVSEMPVNITLTEVHRQALDNPILRVATHLRERNAEYIYTTANEGEFSYVTLPVKAATYEDYKAHDQVLCGRNATRHKINSRTQARLLADGKFSQSNGPLYNGDRVVFLRNDYDTGVFNGTIGRITETVEPEDDHAIISGTLDEGTFEAYEVWQGLLQDQEMSEAPRFMQVIDLAYALTVHKAQGSEWDSVLIQHEPVGHGTDQMRWLYTAITRARKKCTLVVPSN
jgi:exodeoxyribonuclease V